MVALALILAVAGSALFVGAALTFWHRREARPAPNYREQHFVCEAPAPDDSLRCNQPVGHLGWHRNAETSWYGDAWDCDHWADTQTNINISHAYQELGFGVEQAPPTMTPEQFNNLNQPPPPAPRPAVRYALPHALPYAPPPPAPAPAARQNKIVKGFSYPPLPGHTYLIKHLHDLEAMNLDQWEQLPDGNTGYLWRNKALHKKGSAAQWVKLETPPPSPPPKAAKLKSAKKGNKGKNKPAYDFKAAYAQATSNTSAAQQKTAIYLDQRRRESELRNRPLRPWF